MHSKSDIESQGRKMSLVYVFNSVVLFSWLCLFPVIAQNVCQRDGLLFNIGDTIKENCNVCTCVSLSRGALRYGRFRCTIYKCLIQPTIIDAVNNGRYSWRASNYSEFWGMTLADGVRYKLGTNPLEDVVASMNNLQVDNQGSDWIPLSFDARNKWPNLLQPPQDQGNCGASWAFSTAGVAADRISIETSGLRTNALSPQHLISCAQTTGDGCNSGHLDRAWNFIRNKGILPDSCYNYRSGQTKSAGKCLSDKSENGCLIVPRLIHTTPAYRISNKETDIMIEIIKNGPVQTLMMVNEDFFMYKSGIYRYSTNSRNSNFKNDEAGHHSIRIIGWGEESMENGENVKYWVCVNSWGKGWGENGYFRIERGQFESFTIAAHLSIVKVGIPSEWLSRWSDNNLMPPGLLDRRVEKSISNRSDSLGVSRENSDSKPTVSTTPKPGEVNADANDANAREHMTEIQTTVKMTVVRKTVKATSKRKGRKGKKG